MGLILTLCVTGDLIFSVCNRISRSSCWDQGHSLHLLCRYLLQPRRRRRRVGSRRAVSGIRRDGKGREILDHQEQVGNISCLNDIRLLKYSYQSVYWKRLWHYWVIMTDSSCDSFGESWGEQGYMRLARNCKNHCGIASKASYPLMWRVPAERIVPATST